MPEVQVSLVGYSKGRTKFLKGVSLMKNEKGFSLIEVVIALLLLGIIGVALLGGLATASMALFIADERATAESLARSQMEYIKSQNYSIADPEGEATYIKINDSQIPEGYTIYSLNRSNAVVQDIVGVAWNLDPERGPVGPLENDTGFQLIRLVIKHADKEVMTLEGAKVKR